MSIPKNNDSMSDKKPLSVMDFIITSTDFLKRKSIEHARLNAELLLCEVLKCDRVKLYLEFDKPLTDDETKLFRNFLIRRGKSEPLQYITGKANFFGYEFKVTPDVLIPRPETEILVEKVLEDISAKGLNKVSIFEIGSGSGCISVSLSSELEKKNISHEIFSIDVSEKSITISEENLGEILPGNKKVKFFRKDVFEIEKLNKNFDYIVSNPPYISKEDSMELEEGIRLYEPETSLTDNSDGYTFFLKIMELASDNKFTGKVFCEIGYNQREYLEKIIAKKNFSDCKFHKDYAGIERILEISK